MIISTMNAFHSTLSTLLPQWGSGIKNRSHAILRFPYLVITQYNKPVIPRASPSSHSPIIHHEKLFQYRFNKYVQYLSHEYPPQLKKPPDIFRRWLGGATVWRLPARTIVPSLASLVRRPLKEIAITGTER